MCPIRNEDRVPSMKRWIAVYARFFASLNPFTGLEALHQSSLLDPTGAKDFSRGWRPS
jgi:hypothetical protein